MGQKRWRNRAWVVLFVLNGSVGCKSDNKDDNGQDSESSTGAQGAAPGSGHTATSKGGADEDDAGVVQDTSDTSEPPRVRVDSGELEGAWVKDGAVRSFLGVPYAKPPTGALRWQAPQPPQAWKHVRHATEFGGRCAQLASKTLQNAASDTEDCLYLNVWAPPSASDGKHLLPVMVWIHGGGNVNGSASEPVPFANSGYFYSGENLSAEQHVVVVTLNYRLGVFGFLAHQGLADEGSPSGNQGLWDQVFALKWVQQNIEAFGGDPEQVTIFGESAGSFDVCAHVSSPKSRSLFANAISESGGCTTYQPTSADARAITEELAKQVSCDQADDVLGCLRKKPVDALLMAASKLSSGKFAPNVDGEFWPDQPRNLFDSGDVATVPYILGSNTDEGTLFTNSTSITSQKELETAIEQFLNVPVKQVLEQYPIAKFKHEQAPYQAAFARIVGDSQLVCSTYDSAVRYAATGADTYMYNFDIPANVAGLGATHGSELVYVFGTSPSLSDEQQAAAHRIRTYWANLAKHGDPNADGLLEWPKFGDQDVRLNFALKTTVVHDFRAKECEFWRGVYAKQFDDKTKP